MRDVSTSVAVRASICMLFAFALDSCASTGGRKAQAEFVQFVTQLSGDYDNSAQTATQPQLGVVQVNIQPAYAPALGKQVFYVHETAAGDARRLISQRLVAVEIGEHGQIKQRDWVFADPPRWRTAREQPDLFKSLILDDVKETPPRKLLFEGDELTLQIAPGQSASALHLRRLAR